MIALHGHRQQYEDLRRKKTTFERTGKTAAKPPISLAWLCRGRSCVNSNWKRTWRTTSLKLRTVYDPGRSVPKTIHLFRARDSFQCATGSKRCLPALLGLHKISQNVSEEALQSNDGEDELENSHWMCIISSPKEIPGAICWMSTVHCSVGQGHIVGTAQTYWHQTDKGWISQFLMDRKRQKTAHSVVSWPLWKVPSQATRQVVQFWVSSLKFFSDPNLEKRQHCLKRTCLLFWPMAFARQKTCQSMWLPGTMSGRKCGTQWQIVGRVPSTLGSCTVTRVCKFSRCVHYKCSHCFQVFRLSLRRLRVHQGEERRAASRSFGEAVGPSSASPLRPNSKRRSKNSKDLFHKCTAKVRVFSLRAPLSMTLYSSLLSPLSTLPNLSVLCYSIVMWYLYGCVKNYRTG